MKRIIFIAASAGAGAVSMAAIIIGGLLWYSARPKPPKPWNPNAIVSNTPAGFGMRDNEDFNFTFGVENFTSTDYEVADGSTLKIMVVQDNSTFTGPYDESTMTLETPVFIPAKQKGRLRIHFKDTSFPPIVADENPQQYHERLRGILNDKYKHLRGFAIFDDAHRYQINLPKWLPTRPKE